MKIVHVIGGLDVGGAQRQLRHLAEHLVRLADVTVVVLSTAQVDLLPEFERIPGLQMVLCPKRTGIDAALVPRLVARWRRERPTIVHTWLRTANYWGRVAGWLAHVPIRVASERNIEVERGRVANALDRALGAVTDRIVVNSVAIRDHLTRTEGLSERKIEVIPNGVMIPPPVSAAEIAAVRHDLGLAATTLVALVGRLVPQKNPGLFLDMARAVRQAGLDCGFAVIGDGPLRGRLECQARQLGIQGSVRFTGFRADVPRLLKAMDLLVLTSNWEGSPNVLLEASAAGLPAVATDVGGVREVITDGITGHVVPPGDVAALVQGVSNLLARPELRREYGRRARQFVEQSFSMSVMIRGTTALYDRLLRARGLPALLPA